MRRALFGAAIFVVLPSCSAARAEEQFDIASVPAVALNVDSDDNDATDIVPIRWYSYRVGFRYRYPGYYGYPKYYGHPRYYGYRLYRPYYYGYSPYYYVPQYYYPYYYGYYYGRPYRSYYEPYGYYYGGPGFRFGIGF